jgi:glycosyltransferase involved in cell wall biosynthesis
MRLAWHLRSDVSAGRSLDDPDTLWDLHLWWLCAGRHEFPAVPDMATPEAVAAVSEIVRPAQGPEQAPVTRLMAFVRRTRPDDTAGFDDATPEGRQAFAAWFYVCAVPEMGLFDLLDARQRAWLSQPLTPPLPPAGLPLTRLVGLTWENRADARAAFDPNTPAGAASLLAWYHVHGACELRHQEYVSWLPPEALFAPQPDFPGLTGLGLLVWLADETARSRWNPNIPEDRAELAAWLEAEGGLPGLAQALATSPHAPRRAPTPLAPPRHAFGANIIGYARGELGIGEDSRMCALSLAAAEVPFGVVNIPVGSNTREQDASLDSCLCEDAPYPVNIFCLTGLDTARLWLQRGPALFAGRINIGYWPWELPAWPETMAQAYELVDEIWVSSAYTRDAFARSAPIPVRLMPMAVVVDRLAPLPRSHFGLPEDRFLFLYTFDCNSYLARKNPLAAIRAFRAAFPRQDAPVALVLKTMNARPNDPRWAALAAEAACDGRILFLEKTMDRGEVLGLFAACDAYVSPHRAEGFGRTLAEAMLLGRPVIATGHSGNADFLTPQTGFPVPYRYVPVGPGEYPFGEGLAWAEPDSSALARAMRRAWAEPETVRDKIARARDLMLSRHHPGVTGRRYRERLELLSRR